MRPPYLNLLGIIIFLLSELTLMTIYLQRETVIPKTCMILL